MLFKNNIQHWMSESKIISLNHQSKWELFLVKSSFHYVYKINIVRHKKSVYFDYNFEKKDQSTNNASETYLIQYIVNLFYYSLHSIQLFNSSHKELKIAVYNRKHFVSEFKFIKTLFLLFIFFIDEFDLY